MKNTPIFQIIFVLFLFALANLLTGCGAGSDSGSGSSFSGSILKVNLLSKSSMEKSGEMVSLGVEAEADAGDEISIETDESLGRERESGEADESSGSGDGEESVSCRYYSGEVVEDMGIDGDPREQNTSEMNHVVLVLSEVSFVLADGSEISKSINKTIDLLSLGESGGIGISSVFQLPEGEYSKITLHFICSEIHFADGAVEPMQVSENDSIELVMAEAVTLDASNSKEINITFDETVGISWENRRGWQLLTEGFQVN
jgi:hypothetical protein